MSTTEDPGTYFAVSGGAIAPDAPSYVPRRADEELAAALIAGEYCYVLTPRQMGKTSLMVRTANRLAAVGTTVVVIDLTTIGHNLDLERWYASLRAVLGDELGLERELTDHWKAHADLPPLDRWIRGLRDVVLDRITGPIVIFLDEIDYVRRLPFSTDEFFAAIRACHNSRTHDPRFDRLTFAILGTVTPSELIQDSRTTPFNIGKRIELNDFTIEEASRLAAGLPFDLERSKKLMRRIMHWTAGQPYLTQALCRKVAETARDAGAEAVDHACEELFFSGRARSIDKNLQFVGNYILNHGEARRSALLHLYERVIRGRPVRDDETSPLVGALHLSGLVRSEDGLLRPRNRIYRRVFDRAWVRENSPEAERLRQRAAFRRGVLMTGSAATLIIATLLSLVVYAWHQEREASRSRAEAVASADQAKLMERKALLAAAEALEQKNQAESSRKQAEAQSIEADTQRRYAIEREREARQSLYVTHINLAQKAWEQGETSRARAFLHREIPAEGQEDLRGFEWHYLHHLVDPATLATLNGHGGAVNRAVYAPDGKTIATASQDGYVGLWDAESREILQGLAQPGGATGLLIEIVDHHVVVQQVPPRLQDTIRVGDRILSVMDSEGNSIDVEGKELSEVVELIRGEPGTSVTLLIASEGEVVPRPVEVTRVVMQFQDDPFVDVVFSPDGRRLAAATDTGGVRIWDLETHTRIQRIGAHEGRVAAIRFGADGATLTSVGFDGTAAIWNVDTGEPVRRDVLPSEDDVGSVAVAPGGKLVATSTSLGFVQLLNLDGVRPVSTLIHPEIPTTVSSLAFSADGAYLAAGLDNGAVMIWDLSNSSLDQQLWAHDRRVSALDFSPDGTRLATAGGESTKLWDLETYREINILRGHGDSLTSVAFAPDGERLVSSSQDHTAIIWDADHLVGTSSLDGAFGPVFDLRFTPDASKLVTVGGLNALNETHRTAELKIWDVDQGGLAGSLQDRSDPILSSLFTPDGKTAVVAGMSLLDFSRPGLIHLIDVPSGRVRRELSSSGGPFLDLAISPDGTLLATSEGNPLNGNVPSRIKTWDIASGTLRDELEGNPGIVNVLAFGPRGRSLIATDWAGLEQSNSQGFDLIAWDLEETSQPCRKLSHIDRETTSDSAYAFSDDGLLMAIPAWDESTRKALGALRYVPGPVLAIGGLDGSVWLWDGDTGEILGQAGRHDRRVSALAFSPDGRLLVSGSTAGADATRPGLLQFWDLEHGRVLAEFPGSGLAVNDLDFSDDGRFVVVVRGNEAVEVYEVKGPSLIARLEDPLSSNIITAALSPRGETILTGSFDGRVRLWESPSGTLRTTVREPRDAGHADKIIACAMAPDGRWLATGGLDQRIFLWDLESGRLTGEFGTSGFLKRLIPTGHSAMIRYLAASPDGRLLASASEDQTIKIWDVASRKLLRTLEGHEATIWGVAFSPDGTTLASCGNDSHVRLWDLATYAEIAARKVHDLEYVFAVEFSRDGKTLVTGGGLGTLTFWDVTDVHNPRHVEDILAHDDQIYKLLFTPDGKTLATASKDWTVKLWNLATRAELLRFQATRGSANGLDFSSDGSKLAVGGADNGFRGVVNIWHAGTGANTPEERVVPASP